MHLAVSNIAWDPRDEPSILDLLRNLGVPGIEVAPTKIWPDWNAITIRSARAYASRLADEGFCIPSVQAILYGLPHLKVFADEKTRDALVEHIKVVAELAANMGAKNLVFGAPKNRLRGDLDFDEACQSACTLFSKLARVCHVQGTCLCIEPNPVEYGCDFITSTSEGIQIVEAVSSAGFGLHLDSSAMTLTGEDIVKSILSAGHVLRHYHASEPMLSDFSSVNADHFSAGRALRDTGYDGWIAIEMVMSNNPHQAIRRAVGTVQQAYNL